MSTNAKISLWDNSTQGLDASTSIKFGKSLQVYTRLGENIAVAALYQASDGLVNLFDKVTILSKGQQIFFGTIQEAQDYFTSFGFVWPERQSLSEFFIAVTDQNLRITKDGWEDRVPRSIDDFVKCWKQSTCYHKLQEDIARQMNTQFQRNGDKVSKHRVLPHAKSSYVLSWPAQM
jgi:ABC-type multidrug transport system ATPase subunit